METAAIYHLHRSTLHVVNYSSPRESEVRRMGVRSQQSRDWGFTLDMLSKKKTSHSCDRCLYWSQLQHRITVELQLITYRIK